MLIQTAFVVAATLCTWALVDFVLVFVTSLLPKHIEIDCAKQYAPQRIAIVGPPKGDASRPAAARPPPQKTRVRTGMTRATDKHAARSRRREPPSIGGTPASLPTRTTFRYTQEEDLNVGSDTSSVQ